MPGILADREQIRSVVTNLVLNARDATGAGGRIQVQTVHLGNRVQLTVADNGCGMSQAFLKESLFRPFQSTKTKGLGIGLFQSRDGRREAWRQPPGGERGRQGHHVLGQPSRSERRRK